MHFHGINNLNARKVSKHFTNLWGINYYFTYYLSCFRKSSNKLIEFYQICKYRNSSLPFVKKEKNVLNSTWETEILFNLLKCENIYLPQDIFRNLSLKSILIYLAFIFWRLFIDIIWTDLVKLMKSSKSLLSWFFLS